MVLQVPNVGIVVFESTFLRAKPIAILELYKLINGFLTESVLRVITGSLEKNKVSAMEMLLSVASS